MNVQSMILIAGATLVVLFAFFFLWNMIARYRRNLGIGPGSREKTENVSFVLNAFQDVTRQLKEKERELERLKSLAEQRAESVASYTENILQCVTNGVVTFSPDGTVVTMNRAAAELLDRPLAGAEGKSCREIFGDGDVCAAVRHTGATQQGSIRMEAPFDSPAGRIWLGYNTAVLTDARGGTLGVIVSFSDLTEVKRLQEQVELRERLTALGEMSAGIAHELRNPMAVIAGYLNLLSKKADAGDQATIKSIQSEISGMNRIIGDLLTFARPAALAKSEVNLRELLESCAEALAARSEAKNVALTLRLENLRAMVDEGLFRQALGNILQNACEAMTGGGALAIEASAGNGVTIRISDTGAGIPPDLRSKIFLPFFTTKDKGVGMGLALTHKIITAHGGRIDVESDVGRGTTFTITLPKT